MSHKLFKVLSLLIVAVMLITACSSQPAAPTQAPAKTDKDIKVGLITKTETNPFFVKMKEGAQQKADELGVTLLTGAGNFDGDNETQVTLIENMVNAGVKGILITANDTKAIIPAIKKARDAGVLVIALDSPTDPADGVDALFATDNFKAGVLIGQYSKSAMGSKPLKIATLDLLPGIAVGVLRHNGFLAGMGLSKVDATAAEQDMPAEVVCAQDAAGDQAKGQTAMENCLQKNPDINLVYTINEPVAFGAYTALKAAGKEKDVVIVSVDGGCQGTQGVVDGQIAATSQQYPLKMASMGVQAVVDFAKTGKKVSGYVDTGVTLISDKPQSGVDSKDTAFGLSACWGEKAEPAAVPVAEEIKVGLITKTDSNPFFVKMREGAQAKADELGVTLLTGTGNADGDNESQVTVMENMVNAGVKGILITPNDTKAIVPSIKKARDAGVLVIALDSPTDPRDGVDALFATNNFKAGVLIGQYAKVAMGSKPLKIATLDLLPGIAVGVLRHNGFLSGMGLSKVDDTAVDQDMPAEVVCAQDAAGDQAKGQTAMENCLQKNPDINLVYTINEPVAFGAYTALKAAGKEKDVVIVSVDGGCKGVQGVVDGQIAATSQQYPLLMASMGVEAIVDFAKTGKKASGYVDTGVTLISDNPMAGVDSKDTAFGLDACWGTK